MENREAVMIDNKGSMRTELEVRVFQSKLRGDLRRSGTREEHLVTFAMIELLSWVLGEASNAPGKDETVQGLIDRVEGRRGARPASR
jgi:hypothetical protein